MTQTPNTQEPPGLVEAQPVEWNEPRWPAWMVFLNAWWRPATTARRTQHISLKAAYGVHGVASVLGFVILCVLIAWIDRTSLLHVFDEILEELWRGYSLYPAEAAAATVASVLGFEVGFVALALLLGPWGARDERVRASIANALRHTWLHTASVLPALILVGCVIVPLDRVRQDWYGGAPSMYPTYSPPAPPTPPTAPRSDTQAWADYQQKWQEYNQKVAEYHTQYQQLWENWYEGQPWYVRHADVISVGFCFAAGLWILWALMRAIGAERPVTPIERPPTCEFCGYNLTTMPMEARCPECGEPVYESLGPHVRPGADWERRGEFGWLSTGWRTATAAIFRPTLLGRRLSATRRVVDHRLFLILSTVMLFFIGYATLIGIYYADVGKNPLDKDPEVAYLIAPMFGVFVATCGLAGGLLATGVIGLWASTANKRNLIPAGMQMAGYLGPFQVLGGLVSGAVGVLMMYAHEEKRWFSKLELRYNIDEELIAFAIWTAASLVMVLVWLVLMYKGIVAARFANR